MTIGIVDYGAGNLLSVKKAFDFLGLTSSIITGPEELAGVERLVLPGVGAFGPAWEALRDRSFLVPLRAWLSSGKPFLGICLGLQLLFQSSEEAPGVEGLAVFEGACRRFRARKVPQIGWNSVEIRGRSPLFEGISPGEYFYYVHSYYVRPQEPEVVMAESDYEGPFAAAVGRARIQAVQFHPEKSGRAGLQILRNWVERC